MVIRGKIRGNGSQLAGYLMKQADNDNVRILDIRGTSQPDDLKASLLEMSLTSELTMSDKGLYHAQINPAYGEDKLMDADSWNKAATILESELQLEGQKRVIVLHEKKGRIHAHVVWERYDHENEKMVSDSFSRLAQDRARKTIERALEHQPTPHRNDKRPEMKIALTELWQKTLTGADFIKASLQKGYTIAKGELRRPFMVVDNSGRSFDLVRQLDNTKSKEVRERLKDEKLRTEKEVIQDLRLKQNSNIEDSGATQQDLPKPGHWNERFEQKVVEDLDTHQQTEKERMIRELQKQLEQQRKLASSKQRGR